MVDLSFIWCFFTCKAIYKNTCNRFCIETGSFVSDKNTNVDSVQFVIKTDEIEKEEAEDTTEDTEESLTFIQKVLKLFGIE